MKRKVVVLFSLIALVAAVFLLFREDSAGKGTRRTTGTGGPQETEASAPREAGPLESAPLAAKLGERPSLASLADQGMVVKADELGDRLAKGNVSVSFPGGGRLETDAIRVTAEGSLRTEGDSVLHVDGGTLRFSGAASLQLDEKKRVALRVDEGSTMFKPLENK